MRLMISAAAVCMFAVGCTPWTTRFPSVYPSEPYGERRSFERYDPFSSIDAGPDTMARPREFMRPRTQARSDAQERFLRRSGIGGPVYRDRPYFPAYSMPPQPPPLGY